VDYQIVYNSGALRLSDGRLVLADDATRELRFYDSLGQHLRTVGGQGSGPGEFRRLRSIARLKADTVFAWDLVQRRMSLFSPDGAHLRTAPVPALQVILGELQRRYPRHFAVGASVHRLHTGSLVVEPLLEPNIEFPTETQLLQDTLLLYAIDSTGEDYVELGSYPAAEWFFHAGSGARLPFGENLLLAAAGDALYVGSTRNRTIRVLSPATARVIGSIELPLQARAPSREDIEQVRRRQVERMQPAMREAAESYMDAITFPAAMPLFSDLRVAADHRLWVQAYRAPTDEFQEWLIFEPSGSHVASVAMDPSAVLLDAGADYVVTRVTDELDLQEIRVHRLTGGG
jgi:hypothetical protein